MINLWITYFPLKKKVHSTEHLHNGETLINIYLTKFAVLQYSRNAATMYGVLHHHQDMTNKCVNIVHIL